MVKPDTEQDDWSKWRNHVLAELKRQNDNIEALRDKIDENEKCRMNENTTTKLDINTIQVKIWAVGIILSMVFSAATSIAIALLT